MFRLQDNAPEVYVNNSRDFQLFCRLYDSLQNGVKYNIDTISKTSSTQECPVTMLPLLKTKLGLFGAIDASDYELTMTLRAFPSLIRHKGTISAVTDIVTLFHRMSHDIDSPPMIELNDGNIHIIFQSAVSNEDLLVSLLELVAPAGCEITYEITKLGSGHTDFRVDTSVAFTRYNLERDGVAVVFRHASLTSGMNTVTFKQGMRELHLTYRAPTDGEYTFNCNGVTITGVSHIGDSEEISVEKDGDNAHCNLYRNGSYDITFYRTDASNDASYNVFISVPMDTDDLKNTVGLTYVYRNEEDSK